MKKKAAIQKNNKTELLSFLNGQTMRKAGGSVYPGKTIQKKTLRCLSFHGEQQNRNYKYQERT